LAGAIILIMAMATALTNYIIQAKIPHAILDWFEAKGMSEPWHFIIVLNIFLFILGMLMDAFSALLVALPLLIPLAAAFHLNPFYLAVMFLLNLEIAYVTPPVGLNLFISSFRFRRPVVEIYRVVLPFVGLLAVGLLAIILVPSLSSFTVHKEIDRIRQDAKPHIALSVLTQDSQERLKKRAPGGIQGCYTEGLKRNARLSGRVVAKLDSNELGRVTKYELEGKLEDEKALKCATERFSELYLPLPLSQNTLPLAVRFKPLGPPRQAWALECVQEDRNNLKPCIEKDIAEWGKDGKRSPFAGKPGDPDSPSGKPDDDDSEESMDDLLNEFDKEDEDEDDESADGGADASDDGAAPDGGDEDEDEDEDEVDVDDFDDEDDDEDEADSGGAGDGG